MSHFLITAGPTREALDPVRFISNRSTGKMGFALAEAAAAAGHQVTLIAGPVTLATPTGVKRIDIESARDLLAAVERELPIADIYISSAAIADWRPETYSETKLKKAEMDGVIRLVRNPDVLKTILPLKGDRLFVGFAAETGNPTQEATRKLRDKGLDFIVANDVTAPGAGFAVDTNQVTLLFPNGTSETLPLMSKRDVAEIIIQRIVSLQAKR
ncbi:MAG: phosphopantothenoylcysteine decarboxylase [bacterium]|nr:phosphopantothenoylcysteine decarboxylase [bacterium]